MIKMENEQPTEEEMIEAIAVPIEAAFNTIYEANLATLKRKLNEMIFGIHPFHSLTIENHARHPQLPTIFYQRIVSGVVSEDDLVNFRLENNLSEKQVVKSHSRAMEEVLSVAYLDVLDLFMTEFRRQVATKQGQEVAFGATVYLTDLSYVVSISVSHKLINPMAENAANN